MVNLDSIIYILRAILDKVKGQGEKIVTKTIEAQEISNGKGTLNVEDLFTTKEVEGETIYVPLKEAIKINEEVITAALVELNNRLIALENKE